MYLKVITSFLFIIPVALTFFEKLYFYSAVILFSMISSFLYHVNDEKKYKRIDAMMSVFLMLTNVFFMFSADFIYPFTHISLLTAGVSFYFWFRSHKVAYDLYHSLWHISSMLITLCIIIGFIEFRDGR